MECSLAMPYSICWTWLTCLTLVVAWPTPSWSQASAEKACERTISVSGIGEVQAKPDMATITLGVETEASEAAQALNDNSQAMEKLLQVLQEHGLKEKDIQTTNLNVSPRYDRSDSRTTPKIIGYTVTNQVRVTVRDLDKLGKLLDASVETAANRIHGISFDVSEPDQLLDKARHQAMQHALHKAQQLAKDADVKLGEPLQISESSSNPPRPVYARQSLAADASKAVPISRGQQTITANVSVVFAIR